jgi:predicted  nucleic acid-binding Zn-ribbon protein
VSDEAGGPTDDELWGLADRKHRELVASQLEVDRLRDRVIELESELAEVRRQSELDRNDFESEVDRLMTRLLTGGSW